jgi:acetyltransferase-like isoleucine patch superfamily enzyme
MARGYGFLPWDVTVGAIPLSRPLHLTAYGGLKIEKNVLLPQLMIRHRPRLRDAKTLIRNQGFKLGSVEIGNDVWLAANVVIVKGVRIGDGAVIGANSVVADDIPPYSIAVGSPCKVIGSRK